MHVSNIWYLRSISRDADGKMTKIVFCNEGPEVSVCQVLCDDSISLLFLQSVLWISCTSPTCYTSRVVSKPQSRCRHQERWPVREQCIQSQEPMEQCYKHWYNYASVSVIQCLLTIWAAYIKRLYVKNPSEQYAWSTSRPCGSCNNTPKAWRWYPDCRQRWAC